MPAPVKALSNQEPYKTILTARSHVSVSDEVAEYGGNDAGPNPHELLLQALGACTSITLRMYANRKQWPLTGVEVDLEYLAEGTHTTITRNIKLHGNLTEEQQNRLMVIADKCPIHKLLTGTISIHSTLV